MGLLPDRWRLVSTLRSFLDTSLWPQPVAAMLIALVSAALLVNIDQARAPHEEYWFLFGGQSESAREVLSTIASSLLSFTGLVFSITVLVLQLASTQFSSRVLRTFLRDRTTRLTMATFVGSFVFALVVLTRVREEGPEAPEFVPALSVSATIVLLVLSVAVFVRYIHHMAHAIRVVNVITRVAEETRESLDRLYPSAFLLQPPPAVPRPQRPPDRLVHRNRPGGVVVEVDEEALIELATRHRGVIALVPFVGDFVPFGSVLFRVWSEHPPDDEALADCVMLGVERTPHQDTAFGFRELVDIAERALSPAINDPTTAVQALDQIHDLLRRLATREIPAAERVDHEGQLRLVLPRPDWDAYVNLALEEICLFGRRSIQVHRRVRALIADLLQVVPAPRRAVLAQQLETLEASVREAFDTRYEQRLARTPSAQGQGEVPDEMQREPRVEH